MRSLLRVRASRLSAVAGRPALALAAARALPPALSRLARPGTRALSDVAAETDGEAEEAMILSSPVLSRAIQLLLAQENQGVAADISQDALVQSILLNPRLSNAIIAYFTAHKDMAMRAAPDMPGREAALGDAYASLIYACVKMRRLDAAFDHHNAMRLAGVPVDARVYAALLKGCGRAKKVRQGESFFRELLARGERSARDVTVYNALLNMHAHQLPRSQFLGPHHVADSWRVFNDMVAQGVMPNEVTYNSLISLCSRTRSPDFRRAEMVLAEMQAVGVPPSNITVTALMQVYGRADVVRRGRDKLAELQKSGIAVEASMWRPLLHRMASRGDVPATDEIIDEIKRKTGKEVFDTYQYKPCYVHNYRLMAVGHSVGYEAALKALHEAREAGQTDPLTYNYLIHVALGARSEKLSAERLQRANRAWEMMAADGMRPSIALCHRMLGVWAQSNQLDRAEAAFESMRAASKELLESSTSLAALWEDAIASGDLSHIAEQLAGVPSLMLGHTFTSYVRMIEACVRASAPAELTAKYVWAATSEAAERGTSIPWHVSEAILRCLTASPDPQHRQADPPPPADAALLDLARQLHLKLAEEGRLPPPGGSVAVVTALMRAGRVEESARALLAAGDIGADGHAPAFWPLSMLQHRQAELEELAGQMPEGAQRDATVALLKQTATIFGEEKPQSSHETAGEAVDGPVCPEAAHPTSPSGPGVAPELHEAEEAHAAEAPVWDASAERNEPVGDSVAAAAGGSVGGHEVSVAELSRRLAEAAEADDFEQCAEIEAEIKRRQAGTAEALANASRAIPSAGPHKEDLQRRLAAAVAEEDFEVAAELEAEIGRLSS